MIENYNELLAAIKKNPALKLVDYKLDIPELISDFGLKSAKKRMLKDYAVQLDEKYNELISFFVNASIGWTHSPSSGGFLYGGFELNGLWESFILNSDFWKSEFSLSPSQEPPENLKHFEQINWFEKQSYSDDDRFGCFVREQGVFPPKIAFFDINWYTLVNLNIDEYFDAMYASCAVKGWQYFYVDISKEMPHWEEGFKDMELAVKYLPQLFPDKDFSYHKTKLEEAKKRLGL